MPASFKGIDFNNRSYGTYGFRDGRHVELELSGGQFRLFLDSNHWFDIQDVFYADVTGDQNPEAIVRMSHLRCIRTCDGTADLFYIYTLKNGDLKEIWQYETGNFDTGCGLKSFTTKNRQLVLEMFGQCPQYQALPKAAKTVVLDKLTRMEFRFTGERFIHQRTVVLPMPVGNDVNYATEIRIADGSREVRGGVGPALN